jgi:hypothetical protein
MILHAAFPHPLLKCLIRFERGPDSLMHTERVPSTSYSSNRRTNVGFCPVAIANPTRVPARPDAG